MKKIILFALTLLVMPCISAQTQVEMIKEHQWIAKQSKNELEAQVSKATKKEAKRLKKEGWMVSPGALPLENQLQRSYEMEYQYDDLGFPKFIMANAQSVANHYDVAKIAATSSAITNLAGQIQTEVTALIESSAANAELSPEEAVSLSEIVMTSKSLISQSIGRTIVIVECHRILKNKNCEVMVRIAYNGEMAKQAAKKAMREELEKKGQNLHEQLDKVLGF